MPSEKPRCLKGFPLNSGGGNGSSGGAERAAVFFSNARLSLRLRENHSMGRLFGLEGRGPFLPKIFHFGIQKPNLYPGASFWRRARLLSAREVFI